MVASNIPFGDTAIFELSYSRSKNPVKEQAARSIHNYFFLKGAEILRDRGILAFITSQGVLNSPKNEPVRRVLMQDNNLVSAIRLPNNLFTDYAGTEVGSDLIILQKSTTKQSLTKAEELFCQSQMTEYNTPSNALFQDNGRIVHTDMKLDTDLYGKPALIYTHRNGVDGIAKDLKQMLSENFAKHLNLELYKGIPNNESIVQIPISQKVSPPIVKPVIRKSETLPLSTSITNKSIVKEERQLSIFDLFENPEEQIAVTISKTIKAKKLSVQRKKVVNKHQPNLFRGLMQQPYSSPVSIKPDNGNVSTSSRKQEAIGDLFSGLNGNNQVEKAALINTIPKLSNYSKEIQSFHRNDCLVTDNGWIGYLKDVDNDRQQAMFHPLQLAPLQKERTLGYIGIRDTYLNLYQKEAEKQTEHKEEREILNTLYDTFVKKYGNLNSANNIKLIKTDSAGNEIPYLERVVGGVVHKADIFHRPVNFSISTLATDNPDEVLASSLNKYGKVNLDYMSVISGLPSDDLKNALQGRIYYDPLQKEYEISELWIAGNVVEKPNEVKTYLENSPNDSEA